MKIAIIRQKFVLYGGAEQFVQGYIHQLAEAGHDIHIFANQWTPSNHPNIHLHHVPSFKFNAFIRTLSLPGFQPGLSKKNLLILFRAMKKPGNRMYTVLEMDATRNGWNKESVFSRP